MTSLARLHNALVAFSAVRFPESGEDDTIGDLHANLAEYDGYVNGVARSLVAGEPAPRIERDVQLRVAIEEAVRGGPELARADALRLLEYLDRLDELVQKVLLVQSAQR